MRKVCKVCKKELDISYFGKNKNIKDGYENKCKKCRLEQRKKYINICKTCGKRFKTQYSNSSYCSAKFKPQNQKNRIIVKCHICNKEKDIISSQFKIHNHFYCSDECQSIGYSKLYRGKFHPKYSKIKLTCEICGKKFERNPYEVNRNIHNYCSKECANVGYGINFNKNNHASWNFKLTNEEREKNRKYQEYNKWRDSVYHRDFYTCQCCGNKRGGNLNAHHLDGYDWCKDKRTDMNNGITLCEDCHKDFHGQYGYGNNTKEQFEEWIKDKEVIYIENNFKICT